VDASGNCAPKELNGIKKTNVSGTFGSPCMTVVDLSPFHRPRRPRLVLLARGGLMWPEGGLAASRLSQLFPRNRFTNRGWMNA
jgi:hypothetical protein